MFAPEQLEEESLFLSLGGEPIVGEHRKFEENVPGQKKLKKMYLVKKMKKMYPVKSCQKS